LLSNETQKAGVNFDFTIEQVKRYKYNLSH